MLVPTGNVMLKETTYSVLLLLKRRMVYCATCPRPLGFTWTLGFPFVSTAAALWGIAAPARVTTHAVAIAIAKNFMSPTFPVTVTSWSR
jgi:hypothetical protein